MKYCGLSFFLAVMVWASVAPAADSNGDFAIRGVGRFSCTELLDALEKKDERLRYFGTWLDGYLSATNQLSPNTFDATPWQTTELMLALLGRACAQRPDVNFMAVVGRLASEMRPLRLTEKSDVIRLSGFETAQVHYRAVIERVRARLLQLGYSFENTLLADDAAFRELRKQVRDFQQNNKLPPTGNLDQHTLLSLFVLPKPQD